MFEIDGSEKEIGSFSLSNGSYREIQRILKSSPDDSVLLFTKYSIKYPLYKVGDILKFNERGKTRCGYPDMNQNKIPLPKATLTVRIPFLISANQSLFAKIQIFLKTTEQNLLNKFYCTVSTDYVKVTQESGQGSQIEESDGGYVYSISTVSSTKDQYVSFYCKISGDVFSGAITPKYDGRIEILQISGGELLAGKTSGELIVKK